MIVLCGLAPYIIGIIWGLYIKNIVPFLVVILIIIFLNNIDLSRNKIKRYFKVIFSNKILIIMLVFFFFGYGYIRIYEGYFNKKIDEQIRVEAVIVSNIEKKEYIDRCTIKIKTINGDNKYSGIKLLLSIKKNKQKLEYGDKIIFDGEYEVPSEKRNYGGFDYRQYLKTKGISGMVYTDKIESIEEEKYNILLININKLRNKIIQNSNYILKENESALLTRILIGNKEGLSKDIIEDFRDSSLSHILAVSGAHVTYIILGISYILSKSKINKRISKVLVIIFLLFFIILTGGTTSVTRACIMAVYILFGGLIYRKSDTISSICLSMFIILAINPYQILDIGFQLSYGGTIGIILFNKILFKNTKFIDFKNKIINYIKQILIVTLSANLIIIPIIMYHYNTISLTFLISNLLIGPIFGIIVILGIATIFISFISLKLSKLFGFILSCFLKILIFIANISSKLPFSKIYVKTPSMWILVFYYLVISFILYKYKMNNRRKKRFEKYLLNKNALIRKVFLCFIIVVIIFVNVIKIIPHDLEIYFVDVGQGDCTLIVTPNNKTILIDGGGSLDKEKNDVGTNTLLPYLLDRHIKIIDYMFITHFDSDHAVGLITILNEIKVRSVFITKQAEESNNYKEFLQIVKNKNIKVILVKSKDVLKIEKNVNIEILWPTDNLISENVLNNNSLVMKLKYNDFSMLFTADIEKIAEEKMITTIDKNKLKCDVLKVAHHGSKTSSNEEFLTLVKPKIALIGVGKNNNFGHPNEEVIKRLQNLNCKIYRTDESGEIILKVNKKGKLLIDRMLN